MDVGLENVAQRFRKNRVLDGITLSLKPGVTALLGPNAAGKSTLMRTLVTDLKPQSGQVWIGGNALNSRPAVRKARERIGYLPQNFGYDPRFTVDEHVEYLAWLRGVPTRHRARAVCQAIDFVDLTAQKQTRMGALSGGSRQRAGIAGSIVGGPELLVLDEPTVGLDPGQRATFRRLVSTTCAKYVLLSTHLTDDVEAIAEHVVLLVDGAIAYDDTVSEFIAAQGSIDAGYMQFTRQDGTEVD